MGVVIRLQREMFDPGRETNAFLQAANAAGAANATGAANAAGAAVTFTGLVRSLPDEPITSLTLEHYEPLARRQLTRFADDAVERFDLLAITIIHRFGHMLPGEPIVQVMTLGAHRRTAFEGAEFVMDFLKSGAPFWKKQLGANGETWVEAKSGDDRARDRWQ